VRIVLETGPRIVHKMVIFKHLIIGGRVLYNVIIAVDLEVRYNDSCKLIVSLLTSIATRDYLCCGNYKFIFKLYYNNNNIYRLEWLTH